MPASRPAGNTPVLAIGEILIDFIVDDAATSLDSAQAFVARSGGAPANVAVALARLGVASAFCGVAGNDPFGSRLTAELTAEDVDTSRLRQTPEAATTLAFAWKDQRGDGHFWLLRGADVLLGPGDADAAEIADLAALVVGSVSLAEPAPRSAVERAVSLATAGGVPVVFDVNLRPAVWSDLSQAKPLCESIARASSIVKLSLDDARGLYGDAIGPEAAVEQLRALGPQAVVLTDGERGCWSASGADEIAFMPSFPVSAVEPTGAGDAFLAALIARSIAADWAPLDLNAIRYAAAAGALATTKRGAWDGLPTARQLDQFLSSS